MIQAKTKPHFWSQLFLSLIAIFALPVVSNVENQPINHNNLSNEQRQAISYSDGIAILVKQVQEQSFEPIYIVISRNILHKIKPHFFTIQFFTHAPIRAGPIYTF